MSARQLTFLISIRSSIGENVGVSFGWIVSEFEIPSYFSGFRNKDVAFFHVASKSLIEADLLFNLPANEQVRWFFSHHLPVIFTSSL